ncbi:MAG: hypothetical protein AAF197_12485, partial [Pseudomonadota bacterium]
LEKKKKRKLIFFVVHGLEANPFDMRHIRAAILTNIPNSSVHLVQKKCSRNITKCHGSIAFLDGSRPSNTEIARGGRVRPL